MDDLYTKSGQLLQLVGEHLHARSGRYLGLGTVWRRLPFVRTQPWLY